MTVGTHTGGVCVCGGGGHWAQVPSQLTPPRPPPHARTRAGRVYGFRCNGDEAGTCTHHPCCGAERAYLLPVHAAAAVICRRRCCGTIPARR